MRRILCIGDIHGRYEALLEVLQKSKFNYSEDTLINLGDENDGGKDTKKVVDELLKIKHLITIRGNHNQWLIDFINKGEAPEIWLSVQCQRGLRRRYAPGFPARGC